MVFCIAVTESGVALYLPPPHSDSEGPNRSQWLAFAYYNKIEVVFQHPGTLGHFSHPDPKPRHSERVPI